MLHFGEEMAKERLIAWSREHGDTLPENIIYYRDGVAEGQYMKVKDIELRAIRSAFAALAADKPDAPTFQLTALIAAKRHHTRFFPASNAPAADMEGKGRNCKPGTLVDDSVTSPFFTDFFLQSHSGLKGTVKPTHYFVLEDEIGIGVRQLQNFVLNSLEPKTQVLTAHRPTCSATHVNMYGRRLRKKLVD
jgi:eukaryotic translation initiation factor 2C